MTDTIIRVSLNTINRPIILSSNQLLAINSFIFRAIILSIPTLIISFQYNNAYCGQISKIIGIMNITLSQWLFWINIIEIIRSYLLILVLLDKSYLVLTSIFDTIMYPLKIGLFIGGSIIVFVSTETCFSEAFILWIVSFMNLISLMGDIASMKIKNK